MEHEIAKISPEGLEMIGQIEREQIAQGIEAEGDFPEKYKLAFGKSPEELNAAADRLMAAGWFPHGSPLAAVDYGDPNGGVPCVVFFQAMIKPTP